MKVGEKTVVALSYTLTVDGQVADQATAEQPLTFVYGAGYLLPKFEEHLKDLEPGGEFAFVLTPEEGYGMPDERMIAEVPRSAFEINGTIEEGLLEMGNQIPMSTSDGHHLLGRVIGLSDESVKMDFNHPMAGKTLDFKGRIESVREATEEDCMPQGGGCSCGSCGEGGCSDGDCGCGGCH